MASSTPTKFERLPVPIGMAALLAFAAIFTTGKFFFGIPILAALFAISFLTRWRLPQYRIIAWSARLLLYFAIILIVGMPLETTSLWYFKQEYTNLGGFLLSAELVVQAWQWRDWSYPREARGVALLLSALIMAAATNTWHPTFIQWIAPLYAAALMFSFRSFSRTTPAPEARGNVHRTALVVLRIFPCLLALMGGYYLIANIHRYEYNMTSLLLRLSARRPMNEAEIGLSEAPRLRPIFNPTGSTRRVVLINGHLIDPHLRAMAFDFYESGQWRPTLGERQPDFTPMQPFALNADADGPWLKVQPMGSLTELRLAPLHAEGVRSIDPLARDRDGVLMTRGDLDQSYEFLQSAEEAHQGPLSIAVLPSSRKFFRLIGFPIELDRKIVALSRQVAGKGDPLTRVERLRAYLRQTHTYSLVFQPHGEPINDFILGNRPAHCELFASAMVVMARSIGVPARFVTGYYAHEYHNGITVVRSRDAHAWAECWIRDKGWMTFDATPDDGRPSTEFGDAGPFQTFWERTKDRAHELSQKLGKISLKMVLLALAALAVVWAIGWLAVAGVMLLFRKRPAKMTPFAPRPDLAVSVRRFNRLLRRRGVTLQPQRTWREQMSSSSNDMPEQYLRFVAAYDAARWGGRDEARQIERLLDAMEDEWTGR